MTMQDNTEESNTVIDLTEIGTFGAKKKFESDFHPDSEDYYFFNVSDEEKKRMFLDKFNQTDKYFRCGSLGCVVESIFKLSEVKLFYKKKEIDEFINVFPELKEQKIAELKLSTYQENINIKDHILLRPTDDAILDLELAKKVFTAEPVGLFLGLGNKSVNEIQGYLLLMAEYRANLLLINYLIELVQPAPAPIDMKNNLPTNHQAEEKNKQDRNDDKTFAERLEAIKNSPNVFFPSMPMSAVIDHFSVFYTKRNTKTNLPYLTKIQFVDFLERAFLGNGEIEKQSLQFSNGEKGFVISRFFDFYNLAVTNHREKGTNKEKYQNLIIDSFSNWLNIAEIKSSFRANTSNNTW
jgi:hypothetical protein